MFTEPEEPPDEDADEVGSSGEGDTDGFGDYGDELEALATDIAPAGEEAYEAFDADAKERIDNASAVLAGSREALEMVRSASTALAERKGRGGAGSSSNGRGRSRGPLGRKGAGRGNSKGGSSISERKARSICKACGQLGHWAGDAECRANSTLVTEREPDTQAQPMQSAPQAEVYAVSVDLPLPISVCVTRAASSHKEDGIGVFDTACGMSVRGSAWFDYYMRRLNNLRIQHLVDKEPISETPPLRGRTGCGQRRPVHHPHHAGEPIAEDQRCASSPASSVSSSCAT